jgi:transcriptional regulator with XRE-family HTH domain
MTEFGIFLSHKLTEKNWSGEELAKKISEDGGTVRAWVRGDRVPRLGHQCIIKIAELFDKTLQEIELIQVTSLKGRKIEAKKKYSKIAQKEYLAPLTKIEKSPKDSKINVNLPQGEHGCISGIRNVAEIMITMLQATSNNKNLLNENILLTFQSKDSIFDKEKDLQNRWQNLLLDSIKNSWTITHLIRLDSNESRRTYEFVSNSLQLFEGPGKYEPMYFNTQKILIPSYGLFLLPKEGLILFSSKQANVIDSAIYTKDKKQLEILKDHYNQLRVQSNSIFQIYNSYEQGNFVKKLFDSDEELGNRIIFSRRLSEITRPLHWYDESHRWAKKLIENLKKTAPKEENIDFTGHIEHRKKRALKVEEFLKEGISSFNFIYPKSCIQSFIRNGYVNRYYYFRATEEERIEQLQRMLDLLDYPCYKIALVEDSIYENIKPSFCEVGNFIFIMEFLNEDDSELDQPSKSQWLLTEDKIIIRSFQEYLLKIWNNIQEINKEKHLISKTLREGISYLEDEIKKRN